MFQNYIFDLYGTLLNIHTDEQKPEVWKVIRMHYARYGALWTMEGMKQAYQRMCREEEQKLKDEGVSDPEIDLSIVFRRLYTEAPVHFGRRNFMPDDMWIRKTASLFRKTSREILHPYRNTMYVLHELKRQDRGVWLLSNAQTLFTVDELKMTGLYDLFDGICISSDQGIRKPQKEFMERMLEEYGIDRDTAVMTGNDIFADIRIAYECGVSSVFLNTDGYTETDIRDQLNEICTDQTYLPRIIQSGDIGELLNTGE